LPQATGLVAELESKFAKEGLTTVLVGGDRGIFDVVVDGEKIYSKHQTGAFPRYGEIPALITERL
jgi:selenoprotein W-related protein